MGDARLSTLREDGPFSAVNTALTLHPAWSATAETRVRTARHRARAGALYGYRWGAHAGWRLPLGFVPAAERALLHAWWRTQERLLFTLDEGAGARHAVCRIAGDDAPLPARIPALPGHWAGVLELAAVDDRLRLGLPFLLDDPLQGLLDQTHLSLL